MTWQEIPIEISRTSRCERNGLYSLEYGRAIDGYNVR